MHGYKKWCGPVLTVVVFLAQASAALEVAGATSSGFPPGTRYQPDPPYRSRSKIDAFRTRPQEETSLVLRGARAIIGLVWPEELGSEPPRVTAADGTPLETRATLASPETFASAETAAGPSNRLMTVEMSPSKPGRYRLAAAQQGSGAYDLIVLDGSTYALEAWMPSLFYQPTDTLVVHARLYNTTTGTALHGLKVTARPRFTGLRSVRLNDDGVAPDEVANDGVYSGTLAAHHVWSVHQLRRRGGDVEVTVKASGILDKLPMRRVAVTGFNWCVGSAGFDALLPATVESGTEGTRIMVPVMVRAKEQGHYHLEGNLVGPHDELIAFSEGEVWLAEGSNTVPLAFDAGIVAAAGVAPPFTLRKVLLEEEGADGPVMVDMRENLGTVGGFTLADLGPAPTPAPDEDAGEDIYPPGA